VAAGADAGVDHTGEGDDIGSGDAGGPTSGSAANGPAAGSIEARIESYLQGVIGAVRANYTPSNKPGSGKPGKKKGKNGGGVANAGGPKKPKYDGSKYCDFCQRPGHDEPICFSKKRAEKEAQGN
jgi:hypothetical protein